MTARIPITTDRDANLVMKPAMVSGSFISFIAKLRGIRRSPSNLNMIKPLPIGRRLAPFSGTPEIRSSFRRGPAAG